MNQYLKIYNPLLLDVLQHVSNACHKLNIDFYVAGAIARDYHLSKDSSYIPTRKTEDIDIAVMVAHETEYQQLKRTLLQTNSFEEHSEPIKLIYKSSIELDLLPFGSIEENGITRLTYPKLFVLEIPGFNILQHFTEIASWDHLQNVKVCSIEGLVLLKLIANDDRPQRTKDLSDIQQIIKLYFEINSDNIYTDHFDLMSLYDTNDAVGYIPKVCAHTIGRKLKHMLVSDAALYQRMITILKKDKDLYWMEMLNGLCE